MKQYCNQLISGSNYIYYVVKYIIKNVMEIFSHSVGVDFAQQSVLNYLERNQDF